MAQQTLANEHSFPYSTAFPTECVSLHKVMRLIHTEVFIFRCDEPTHIEAYLISKSLYLFLLFFDFSHFFYLYKFVNRSNIWMRKIFFLRRMFSFVYGVFTLANMPSLELIVNNGERNGEWLASELLVTMSKTYSRAFNVDLELISF